MPVKVLHMMMAYPRKADPAIFVMTTLGPLSEDKFQLCPDGGLIQLSIGHQIAASLVRAGGTKVTASAMHISSCIGSLRRVSGKLVGEFKEIFGPGVKEANKAAASAAPPPANELDELMEAGFAAVQHRGVLPGGSAAAAGAPAPGGVVPVGAVLPGGGPDGARLELESEAPDADAAAAEGDQDGAESDEGLAGALGAAAAAAAAVPKAAPKGVAKKFAYEKFTVMSEDGSTEVGSLVFNINPRSLDAIAPHGADTSLDLQPVT